MAHESSAFAILGSSSSLPPELEHHGHIQFAFHARHPALDGSPLTP